jgi:hypothetical protein
MRILLSVSLVFGFAIGCGGGGSSDAFVDELSTNSQVALCTDFIDTICDDPARDPALDGFCTDPCINDDREANGDLTSCVEATEALAIDGECANIFVSEVEDCFITGDLDLCAEGGGCMFDAVEAVCPA